MSSQPEVVFKDDSRIDSKIIDQILLESSQFADKDAVPSLEQRPPSPCTTTQQNIMVLEDGEEEEEDRDEENC